MILSNPEKQDKLNAMAAVVATPRRWTAQELAAFVHVLSDTNRNKWTAGSALLLKKLQATTWLPLAPEALVKAAKGKGVASPQVVSQLPPLAEGAEATNPATATPMDPELGDVLREINLATGK